VSEIFHGEAHRQLSTGWFRAGVFGASDGLVTNISLILGFAGANPGHSVVRLAGLAGLIAGGFSMASGEWVSVRAQKESLEYDMRDPELALRTHAREELGIDPSATGSPWAAAISSFVAFSIGALIPLIPWLVTSSGSDAVWSIVLGALASLVFGGAIGWFIRRGTVRWALRQLFVTTLAAAVTFGVGRLVGS
jgi:VIT1/CCC1 family predicted Fe2+/Mn2+ transporter